MKAVIIRKASNVKDWKEIAGTYKCKADEVIIEKTIEVSEGEFKSLCGDFFKNREYITANLDEMYMENGIWHCILVKCAASEIGILIESEGYDYARYTAVINVSEVENG
jgi:hypothetical protein